MAKENKHWKFSEEIKHTAECAFQRAIMLGKESKLGETEVEWYDIEVPVVTSGKARRKCIDLVGKEKGPNGKYVLCELKFRKSSDNGDPEKAAKQIKEYWDLIQKNCHKLHYHEGNGREIKWTEIINPRLIVAANRDYWNSYINNPRRQNRKYNTIGVECYSVDVEKEKFVKQKVQSCSKTYKPELPEEAKIWTLVEN